MGDAPRPAVFRPRSCPQLVRLCLTLGKLSLRPSVSSCRLRLGGKPAFLVTFTRDVHHRAAAHCHGTTDFLMQRAIMLTATAEYALRALTQLARLSRNQVMLGRELATSTGIPPKYLAKVMLALRNAGLVLATR